MIQNDLLHEFIDKTIVSFCNRFRSCLLQLVGTDIVNSLFKYRVSYRHVTTKDTMPKLANVMLR